jgi:hypothetical protein
MHYFLVKFDFVIPTDNAVIPTAIKRLSLRSSRLIVTN